MSDQVEEALKEYEIRKREEKARKAAKEAEEKEKLALKQQLKTLERANAEAVWEAHKRAYYGWLALVNPAQLYLDELVCSIENEKKVQDSALEHIRNSGKTSFEVVWAAPFFQGGYHVLSGFPRFSRNSASFKSVEGYNSYCYLFENREELHISDIEKQVIEHSVYLKKRITKGPFENWSFEVKKDNWMFFVPYLKVFLRKDEQWFRLRSLLSVFW